MAGDRSTAPGRGVVVRRQRDECARGDRAGAGSGAGAAAGPDPAVSTLVVSGKTPQRVAATASVLADWMEGPGAEVPLADVAHTLNHHRARQAKFATVAAVDREQAVAGLRALAAGEPAPGVVGCHEGSIGPGTVFVYSGRGSQWAGMGRQLLADEPAFAAAIAELEPEFVAEAGFSLHDVIAGGKELVGIEQIQLGLIGMQLALTALWRSYGVTPDLVIGHSMGEVAAAVVAGALTPAEGLRVTATRSRLMAPLSGQGTMAMLELDAAATEALIADYPQVTLGDLCLTAPNRRSPDRPRRSTHSSRRCARRTASPAGSTSKWPRTTRPWMRCSPRCVRNWPISPRSHRPFRSSPPPTKTCDARPVFDAEHWATNMRNPVRFQQAIAAAAAPDPPHLHRDQRAPAVDPRHQRNPHAATRQRSRLSEHRHPATRRARHPDLPHQPQHRPHHPPTPNPPPARTTPRAAHHPLAAHPPLDRTTSAAHHMRQTPTRCLASASPTPPTAPGYGNASSSPDLLWLGDHVIDDLCVLPGAAYAEVALAAATDAFGDASRKAQPKTVPG